MTANHATCATSPSKQRSNPLLPHLLLHIFLHLLSSSCCYRRVRAENSLTGIIPPSIGSLKMLQILDLSTNQFSGPIPKEIGNMVNLVTLSLKENSFTGIIPPSIGSLKQLQILDLSTNNLSGPIPAGIGSMASLEILWLSNNQLEGELPSTLSQQLDSLHLNNNSFTGEFPSLLQKCKSLVTIDLGENNFFGNIPMVRGELSIIENSQASIQQVQRQYPSTTFLSAFASASGSWAQ